MNIFDSKETSSFNLIGQVSGVVENKIKHNLLLETDHYIKDYDSKCHYYGLKLSTKSDILTDRITKNTNHTIFISFIHDEKKYRGVILMDNFM